MKKKQQPDPDWDVEIPFNVDEVLDALKIVYADRFPPRFYRRSVFIPAGCNMLVARVKRAE